VERSRDQFLAGARLAGDEHPRILVLGDPPESREHRAHRRASSEQALELVGRRQRDLDRLDRDQLDMGLPDAKDHPWLDPRLADPVTADVNSIEAAEVP
jgi:hypothetical protein